MKPKTPKSKPAQMEFPFVTPKPYYVDHKEGVKRLRAIREALEKAHLTKNQVGENKLRFLLTPASGCGKHQSP